MELRIFFSDLNRHHFEIPKWDAISLILWEEHRESTLCLPSSFCTHTGARHNQTPSLTITLARSAVLPSFILPAAERSYKDKGSHPILCKGECGLPSRSAFPGSHRHPVCLGRNGNSFLSPALRKLYHFPSKGSTVPLHCARTALASWEWDFCIDGHAWGQTRESTPLEMVLILFFLGKSALITVPARQQNARPAPLPAMHN